MKAQLIFFIAVAFLLANPAASGQMNATKDILLEINPYRNDVNPAGPKPKTQTSTKAPMPAFRPIQDDQLQPKGGDLLKTTHSPAQIEQKLKQSGFEVYNGSLVSDKPSIWIPIDFEDHRYTLCLGVQKTSQGSTIQLKRVYPEQSQNAMKDYSIFLDSLKQVLN